MLDHVGLTVMARRLRDPRSTRCLNEDKVRTRDLGGTASTQDFAQAVVRRVAANV